jgi:hypothetical protein
LAPSGDEALGAVRASWIGPDPADSHPATAGDQVVGGLGVLTLVDARGLGVLGIRQPMVAFRARAMTVVTTPVMTREARAMTIWMIVWSRPLP